MTRWYFQAVSLDELRRLLYPREIAMKELNPKKGRKSSRIHEDDDTLPEEFTLEELQAMSLEMICKLLYPRTIIMEELECQTDNVKSDTSDKKSQGQDTRADTMKLPVTSEKKSCKRLACMATTRKQSRVTSIDSDSGSPTDYQSASEQNDGEQEYNSPLSDQDSSQNDSSGNSGAEPETTQDDSQTSSWDRFHNSRDSAEDSQESDTEPSPSPSIDTHKKFNKSRGDERKDKSQRYKKEGSFVVPKFSNKDRNTAIARFQAAMDQVDDSVHHSLKGNRNTATLYVGNLEFNTSEVKLNTIFKRIRLEKVTIPRVNGRSKYGFIDISWAHRAPVNPADLCIINSGGIEVNSRPVYFRELREKGNN